MKKYNCLSCDYHTNLKGDYTRHLQTKKHKKSTESQHLVNRKSTFLKKKKMKNKSHSFSVNIAIKFSNLSNRCINILNIHVRKTRTKI